MEPFERVKGESFRNVKIRDTLSYTVRRAFFIIHIAKFSELKFF